MPWLVLVFASDWYLRFEGLKLLTSRLLVAPLFFAFMGTTGTWTHGVAEKQKGAGGRGGGGGGG